MTFNTIYKYTEQRWAERMVRNGEIRIAPIGYYRDIEKHSKDRGDKGEGEHSTYIDELTGSEVNEALLRGDDRLQRGISPLFGALGDEARIKNLRFSTIIGNVLIYCASSILSPRLLKLDSSYDCCIVIPNAIKFFRTITEQIDIKYKVREYNFSPCIYDRREVNIKDETHAQREMFRCILKPKEYQWQHELRCVWYVEDCPPSPINIIAPNIGELCTIISASEISYRSAQLIAAKRSGWNKGPKRNQSCPCGSGLKYKKCCGANM
jgi:hypothetical protein